MRSVVVTRGARAAVIGLAVAWLALVWQLNPGTTGQRDPWVAALFYGGLKSVLILANGIDFAQPTVQVGGDDKGGAAAAATAMRAQQANAVVPACIALLQALLQKFRLYPKERWQFSARLLMNDFKWRHFQGEIILWAVRWYCRYGVSYRDLEQMMGERGVPVDHSTIYHWVQKYAPEMEKRLC